MTIGATTSRSALGRLSEAELLDRAAQGDVDAFDQLLSPRLDRLYRMAVAIVRSEADARDAVQDASVLAWRELPRLRDRARFDAWLSQITVNACRGLLRRQRRVRGREVELDESAPLEGDSHAFSGPSSIEGFAEADAIRRAFERLDPTARALIVLHYVEGRPLAEIGQLLNAPVGTIKWRLSNARHALDRAMEAER